jgi:hypothetical protein
MIRTRLFRAGSARGPAARTGQCTAALRVERLEDRTVPTAFPFTPNAFGGGNFNPFPGFAGQVETASGTISGGAVPDIITAEGPGPGSQSEVRIFSGAAAQRGQAVLIADFFPYGNEPGASQTPGFAGGVFVAAANFSGTGFAQLVTAPAAGGFGHVKVFDFRDPASGQFLGSDPILRTSFMAYPGFLGDVRVATVTRGAGLTPLLVTSSGAGSTASDIRVYNNALAIGGVPLGTFVQPAASTLVFPGFLGGVSIAAGGSTAVPQLFVAPLIANPVITTFNLTPTANGGVTLSQGVTFFTGTGAPPDIRLGSADIFGTGTLDALTSFVSRTSLTPPIQTFEVTPAGAIPLNNFTGLVGFGLFNGTWVASSTFTATPAEAAAATVTAPTTTTTTTMGGGTPGSTGTTFTTTSPFTITGGGTPGMTGIGLMSGTTSFQSTIPMNTANVTSPGI